MYRERERDTHTQTYKPGFAAGLPAKRGATSGAHRPARLLYLQATTYIIIIIIIISLSLSLYIYIYIHMY